MNSRAILGELLEHELLYIKWGSTIESSWIWECLQLLLHSRLLSCDPREQLAALLPSYSRRAGEHHSVRRHSQIHELPLVNKAEFSSQEI